MTGDCLSHFRLSRFKTGDLTHAEEEAASRHLEVCDKCRALSSSMDANISDFKNRSATGLKNLMDALDREPVPISIKRPIAKKALTVGALFAAAAAALLIIVLGIHKPLAPETDPGIAFKGAFSMEVVANRDGNQFSVKNGVALRKDDAIRFVVTVDRPGYLTVFSKDGSGALSPFYPETEPSEDPKPLEVKSAGRVELPGSIVLDDAAGNEEYIVIFSPHVFSRAEVHSKWAAGSETDAASETDALGKNFVVQTITVTKESFPKK